MSYTTETRGFQMGCLANVTNHLHPDRREVVVNMYSRNPLVAVPSTIYPETTTPDEAAALIKQAVSEVIAALPASIYLGRNKATEVAETGKVKMRYGQHPAAVHARIAPFRTFAETSYALAVFNTLKEPDTLGAWLATHVLATGSFGCKTATGELKMYSNPGHHQSMFPGLQYNTASLQCPYNMRRVAALYPELRRHLSVVDSAGLGIDGFRIPALKGSAKQALRPAIVEALRPHRDSMFVGGDSEDVLSTRQGEIVQGLRTWHDTIYNTLNELDTSHE